METTIIITDTHPAAPYIIVLDQYGKLIGRIKEYNIETKEAVLYKVDSVGKAVTKWLNKDNPSLFPRFEGDICGTEIVLERKILVGSRLVFKVEQKYNKLTNTTE